MTRIARPVALSFAGRYGVMLGLWMPATLSSPLAEVVTTSFVGLPSDPGAPPGHSGISAGLSAAPEDAVSMSTINKVRTTVIGSPPSDSLLS